MVPPKKNRITNPKLNIQIQPADAEDVGRELDAFKAETEQRLEYLEAEVKDLRTQLGAVQKYAE